MTTGINVGIKKGLEKVAGLLKSGVAVWGSLTAATATAVATYNDCSECFEMYKVEIGLAVLTVVTSMFIWFLVKAMVNEVYSELNSIQRAMLRGDVDRFFKDHKDDKSLTEDEAEYVYMLRDKLIYHKVNSFTQRKVDALLRKDIQ